MMTVKQSATMAGVSAGLVYAWIEPTGASAFSLRSSRPSRRHPDCRDRLAAIPRFDEARSEAARNSCGPASRQVKDGLPALAARLNLG
jgi:hypothetical protein